MKTLDKFKKILVNMKDLQKHIFNVCEEVVITNATQQLYDQWNTIGITEQKYTNNRIIVSLTSYGERAYNVYLTIVSLMHQSCKANNIILWLADNEFNKDNLPVTLINLIGYGLEVRFCKDIKSYKKLIPTLKEYPNDVIITVDDDIIYPYTFLENFIKEHNAHPKDVLFTRGHKIKVNYALNKIQPYRSWEWNICDYDNASILLLPTGCGGVLYPPKCFCSDIFNEDYFSELAPTADDIWFKTMTTLNHTLCRQIKVLQSIITITSTQHNALSLINNNSINLNDKQIDAISKQYPEIINILRNN